MFSKIAVVAVSILAAFAASPSRAASGRLDINLVRYLSAGSDRYGITFDAVKDGATSCKLATPGDPAGSACSGEEMTAWDLDFAQLTAEIGAGAGTDWTLIWDEGLATETVVLIDFGVVLQSDWWSRPTITHPLPGASGVSTNSSIDWTWPASPQLGNVLVVLFAGDLATLFPGPINAACDSGALAHPPDPTTWAAASCLSPGT